MTANVVLNTKTYTYANTSGGITAWREVSGGVPSSFSPLTARVLAPKKADGAYDVSWKLEVPVVATADDACACTGAVLRAYTVFIDVKVPQGATAAERTDIAARISSLVADSQFQASITGLTQP